MNINGSLAEHRRSSRPRFNDPTQLRLQLIREWEGLAGVSEDATQTTDAAAIPLVALTGDQLVRLATNVQKGQVVLITGALGGVGRAAVHTAKKIGRAGDCRCSREELDAARSLGVSDVLAIDDDKAIRANRTPRRNARRSIGMRAQSQANHVGGPSAVAMVQTEDVDVRHPQAAERKGKGLNGAESLLATLANEGIEICFANPGTSEMHFLAALENPRIRSVLCLFEGVATGAADGWYRMKDHPASTLLHLGPGLANGLANIHNARKAGSGMINIVGDHATAHLKYDPPLASDIEGLARPLSHWVRRAHSPHSVAGDASSAVAQARSMPGKITTLILPGETSWGDAGDAKNSPASAATPASKAPDCERIQTVAQILRSGEPALIVLAGRATRGRALELAGRIAAQTGCRIATQFFTARIERGAGRVPLERIPYYVPAALAFLQGLKHIVTVETGEPVAFFNYPGKPSLLKPADCSVHSLVATDEDSVVGFEMLAEALGADQAEPVLQARHHLGKPEGQLTPKSIAHALVAALPENSILVDESLTTGRETLGLTVGARPHDLLQNMGGSIGFATPVATGAALACPDRRTFCIVGDGSAMYTIQSLWTQAREGLNVTTIIFANNSYQILKLEFGNMGFGVPGPQASGLIDIDKPKIDWVAMGQSMGCPSVRVEHAGDFYTSMINSAREIGPMLIEVCL